MARQSLWCLCPLVVGSTLLTGCQIEPTPEEYIDQHIRTEAIAEEEVEARISALAAALGRGDAAVDSILSPRNRLSAIGPDGGEVITDPSLFIHRLVSLAGGQVMETRSMEVSVAPGVLYAWFSVFCVPAGSTSNESGFRLSGVLVRESGSWRLTHGHLSIPAIYPNGSPAL
ncbi:MAG: nuclear transport factor 2 family protein [Gemmatimonadota bacterium]|nr:nuclear transport factor 2 family protein [Gemmatimonadota bacterium]